MSTNRGTSVPKIGFSLESADSVRFSDDFTPVERERNRQILFGELLCGLLLGEPVWTNAVFAFDSRGMVQALGAVARAFRRIGDDEQFLPLIIAAYPDDAAPGSNARRPWHNPNEYFLRCYAHRIANVDGFTLSATPNLQKDRDKRHKLAEVLIEHAASPEPVRFADFPVELSADEAAHFDAIYSIDAFLRSWFRRSGDRSFADYVRRPLADHPVRLLRAPSPQESRFDPAYNIKSLRAFCEQALVCATTGEWEFMTNPAMTGILAEAVRVLRAELAVPDNPGFASRSQFRHMLAACRNAPVYRTLIELADGHYVRMQYTELTYTAHEVTSPASNEPASDLGEAWAARTMRSMLRATMTARPWQFVNRIQARPNPDAVDLNLDDIAARLADFMRHPDRRGELAKYHKLLAEARSHSLDPHQTSDAGQKTCDALYEHFESCRDHINDHMDGTGVAFSFNSNESMTHAGSLTLSYHANRSICQLTGPPGAALDAAAGLNDVAGFDAAASHGAKNEFDVPRLPSE